MTRITLPDDITDTEAIATLRQVEDRLGWAIGVVTRVDAERIARRPLTDSEWERVHSNKAWRPHLSNVMWQEAQDHAEYAVGIAVPDIYTDEDEDLL